MPSTTTTCYSLNRGTLTNLLRPRYFFLVAPLLLLILATIVVVGTVVASSTNSKPGMETYRSGTVWPNKTNRGNYTNQGTSEEFVWFLREMTSTVYVQNNDKDRVFLRMEGSGVQTIVVKTSSGSEKTNNTVAFTVLEFDMLNVMLSGAYNNDSNILVATRRIYNGRRRLLMDKMSGNRVRFIVLKYNPKKRYMDDASHPHTNVTQG
jgi:hypothetical protein